MWMVVALILLGIALTGVVVGALSDYFWGGVSFSCFVVAGLGAFVLALVGSIAFLLTQSCETTGAAAGYESEWTLYTGCLVVTPEGTFPFDQILELRNR